MPCLLTMQSVALALQELPAGSGERLVLQAIHSLNVAFASLESDRGSPQTKSKVKDAINRAGNLIEAQNRYNSYPQDIMQSIKVRAGLLGHDASSVDAARFKALDHLAESLDVDPRAPTRPNPPAGRAKKLQQLSGARHPTSLTKASLRQGRYGVSIGEFSMLTTFCPHCPPISKG